MLATSVAHAGIVIDTTRVVFKTHGDDISVRLANRGDSPSLTQVWLDEGNARARPESIQAPVLVTPATARIDAGRTQIIRFLPAPNDLPTDRESLFWLNVVEIPPKQDKTDTSTNALQIAFRNRLKFFYRPAALKGSPVSVMDRLSFRATTGTISQPAIELVNPTPYYVTLAELAIRRDGMAEPIGRLARKQDWMAAPFSTITLPIALDGPARQLPTTATIRYALINDQGGRTTGRAGLKTASE